MLDFDDVVQCQVDYTWIPEHVDTDLNTTSASMFSAQCTKAIAFCMQACELQNCDVYSYKTDGPEADPFNDQNSIWAFNYFFYNKKLKRIVYFSCRSMRRNAATEEARSTPEGEFSLRTTDSPQPGKGPDSDSEIVGGMDDLA